MTPSFICVRRSGCFWGTSIDFWVLTVGWYKIAWRTQRQRGNSSLFLYFGPFSSNLLNRVQLSYKVLWIASQAWAACATTRNQTCPPIFSNSSFFRLKWNVPRKQNCALVFFWTSKNIRNGMFRLNQHLVIRQFSSTVIRNSNRKSKQVKLNNAPPVDIKKDHCIRILLEKRRSWPIYAHVVSHAKHFGREKNEIFLVWSVNPSFPGSDLIVNVSDTIYFVTVKVL